MSSSDSFTHARSSPSPGPSADPSRLDKAAQGAAFAALQNAQDMDGSLSKETAKLYKSFMQSYVNRINDATYRVPITGVRIGSAKYSRLAQINLKTRIITFSRFAIENVPERGRRYLVLHELAHVLEASHNKTFWHLVGQFEPDYKDIGVTLDQAFKKNVQSHEKSLRALKRKAQNPLTIQTINSPPPQSRSIIWTPDHGYVEPGSQRFGLHKDPAELFHRASDNNQAEEAYAAYLELQEQDSAQSSCIFDSNSALDLAQDLCVYDDEGDFDLIHGTMSGGDY